MKRHLLTLAGGCAGIALTIALLSIGAATIKGRETFSVADFVLETPDMAELDATVDETAPQDNAGETPPGDGSTVRSIAPQEFGLPEEVTTVPLERIEPRTPLSEPETKDNRPETTVLRHPVALSAGLIRFGDSLLQLEGIEPQDGERICDSGGKPWPCGMIARTAFRNFLRARALVCTVPEGGWTGTVTASCTVATIDPAAWLVENGWATVPAGSPMAEKARVAEKAGLGFSGADPRAAIRRAAPAQDVPADIPGSDAAENALPDL